MIGCVEAYSRMRNFYIKFKLHDVLQTDVFVYVDCIRGRHSVSFWKQWSVKCIALLLRFGCHCFFQLGLVIVWGLNCVIGKPSDYIAGEEYARVLVKVKFTKRGIRGISVLLL